MRIRSFAWKAAGLLAWRIIRSKRARSMAWTGARVTMKTGARLAVKRTLRSAKRDARAVALQR
jgi:hypothetical protein